MSRIVVHNYMTRNVGRFRATAPAHDHRDCHCGGSCDACRRSRDARTRADLAIDVRYAKGPTGAKTYETRHYVQKDVIVNPYGKAVDKHFARGVLSNVPGHQQMLRDNWVAEDVTAYYEREQRDVGARV